MMNRRVFSRRENAVFFLFFRIAFAGAGGTLKDFMFLLYYFPKPVRN